MSDWEEPELPEWEPADWPCEETLYRRDVAEAEGFWTSFEEFRRMSRTETWP